MAKKKKTSRIDKIMKHLQLYCAVPVGACGLVSPFQKRENIKILFRVKHKCPHPPSLIQLLAVHIFEAVGTPNPAYDTYVLHAQHMFSGCLNHVYGAFIHTT